MTPVAERRAGPIVVRLMPAAHPTADLEVVVALLGLVGLLGMWLLPLDALAPLVGTCRFREWTGLPCLTCGTTRAIVALSHGEWSEALRQNPLLTIVLTAGAAYTPAAWLLWLTRAPRPRVVFGGRRASVIALAGILLASVVQWVFLVLDKR